MRIREKIYDESVDLLKQDSVHISMGISLSLYLCIQNRTLSVLCNIYSWLYLYFSAILRSIDL